MTLAEILWENGQSPCVKYKVTCRTRPCTVAQGVFCCKECPSHEQCESACRLTDEIRKWREKEK